MFATICRTAAHRHIRDDTVKYGADWRANGAPQIDGEIGRRVRPVRERAAARLDVVVSAQYRSECSVLDDGENKNVYI